MLDALRLWFMLFALLEGAAPETALEPFDVWFPSHFRKCLKENGFSSLRGASAVDGGTGVGATGEVDWASAAAELASPSVVEEGTAFTFDDVVPPVSSSVLMLLLSFAMGKDKHPIKNL